MPHDVPDEHEPGDCNERQPHQDVGWIVDRGALDGCAWIRSTHKQEIERARHRCERENGVGACADLRPGCVTSRHLKITCDGHWVGRARDISMRGNHVGFVNSLWRRAHDRTTASARNGPTYRLMERDAKFFCHPGCRKRRAEWAFAAFGGVMACVAVLAFALFGARESPAQSPNTITIEVAASEPGDGGGSQVGRPVDRRARSLPEAILIARDLRSKASGELNITIELAPGRHRLAAPVRLGPSDGGTWTAPLVIRPAAGVGTVEISGAVPLRSAGPLAQYPRAREIADAVRSIVKRYRLPPTLAAADSIELPRFHAITAVPLPFEVFDGAGALQPARWPNTGWAQTASVDPGVPSVGFKPSMAPDGRRLAAWSRERDLWLTGYPRYDWSYESLAVGSVDVGSDRLILKTRPRYGLADGRRVAVVHALSELDTAGEWYRDRAAGEIILVPHEGERGTAVEASLAESAFVLEDTSHVQIKDVTITRFRGDAVVVNRGADVVLDRVTISWVAAGRRSSRMQRRAGSPIQQSRTPAKAVSCLKAGIAQLSARRVSLWLRAVSSVSLALGGATSRPYRYLASAPVS